MPEATAPSSVNEPVKEEMPTMGFLVEDEHSGVIFSGDTDATDELWNVANASSDPCMRLDMRMTPSTRMMYSSPRRTSFMAVPSGERASASNSKGFTTVMLQQADYWTGARLAFALPDGRLHRV